MASTSDSVADWPRAPARPVVHSRHGHQWEDPFDWLRQRKPDEEEEEASDDEEEESGEEEEEETTVDDPEILGYLHAEAAYTERMFTQPQSKLIDTLFQEFKSRVRDNESSIPAPHDGYFWYSRFCSGDEYPKYCRAPIGERAAEGPGVPPPFVRFSELDSGELPGELVYLDVNELARQGQHEFIDVAAVCTSPDNQLTAYAVDTLGSERYTLYVKRVADGELLADRVHNAGDDIEWSEDSQGFYYLELDAQFQPYRVRYHRLGTPSGDDVLVYEETDKEYTIGVQKTLSRAYILIDSVCTDASEVRYISAAAAPPADGSGLVVVEPRRAGTLYEIDHHPAPLAGSDQACFFVLTNADGADDFQLMVCPTATPSREHWRTVVEHVPGQRISGLEVYRNHLVLSARRNTLSSLLVVDLPYDGRPAVRLFGDEEEEREALVSWYTTGDNWEWNSNWLRLMCESPVSLPTTLLVDLSTEAARSSRILLKQETLPVPYCPDDYRAVQLRVPSSNPGEANVLIPATLVYKRSFGSGDAAVPFKGPMLLYGYGAYEVPLTPAFSSLRLSLLDRGAAMVLCHVRGGGDQGRAWYLAGRGLSKRNTFTDFVDVARHFVDAGYTRSDQLAALGCSAGGMLMGAVANMAPQLFRAVVADVPFVDCLNTMLSSDLPLVTLEYDEWGNPAADPQAFDYIRSYSPYDNIDLSGQDPRPITLVTAGLHDKRVCYHEPVKYVARYRHQLEQHRNGRPSYGQAYQILLKIDLDAGHFSKTGRYASLKEEAFIYAFVISQLLS